MAGGTRSPCAREPEDTLVKAYQHWPRVRHATGLPVSSRVGGLGPATPPSLETYKVSRTTLAGIESGKS